MMRLMTIAGLLTISFTAFADGVYIDPTGGIGQAIVDASSGPTVSVRLNGDAARALYEALEVAPQVNVGVVTTQTKIVGDSKCMQAIMGDVPGKKSAPRYNCLLQVSRK